MFSTSRPAFWVLKLCAIGLAASVSASASAAPVSTGPVSAVMTTPFGSSAFPAVGSTADAAPTIEVRAHGGGGHRGGGGGGHRGRGGYRGGHGGYGGYGGFVGIPFYGYGAYYGYDYSDCRNVRVRTRSCWRDSDGDRHCGARWVIRRICD